MKDKFPGQGGKVEKALQQESTTYRREDFPKPGAWASRLLTTALSGWEDRKRMMYANAIIAGKVNKRLSPTEMTEFTKWKRLRHIILNQGNPDKPWEYEEFIPDPEVVRKLEAAVHRQQFSHVAAGMKNVQKKLGHPLLDSLPVSSVDDYLIPPAFLSWTRSSRRIFSIDKHMEEPLLSLDYSKAKWSDVLMPFSTFVIEFPKPVAEVGPRKVYAEGVIVMNVTIDDKQKIWLVPLLTETPNIARESFSPAIRKILEETGQGGKQIQRTFEAMMTILKDDLSHAGTGTDRTYGSRLFQSTSYFKAIDLDDSIIDPNEPNEVNTIRKLIAGTCTCLSATGGVGGAKGVVSEVLDADQKGITDPEEVTLVTGGGSLGDISAFQEAAQKELRRRKSPRFHKRRAHKRHLPNGMIIDIQEMDIGKPLPEGELYQGGTTEIN